MIIFCLCLVNLAHGQVISSYTFAKTTSTYTPMTMPDGTLITGISSHSYYQDDAYKNNIPLGFTFIYDGKCYTEIGISTNGYIRLGSAVGTQPYDNQIQSLNNVIAIFGRDLYPKANTSISYKLEPTYFVIEWQNVRQINSNDTENLSFQLRLYKDHKIEFVYGNCTSAITDNAYPQVGLRGNSSADVSSVSVNSSGSWDNPPTPTNSPNSTCIYSNLFPLIKPSNDLVYRFTPPAKALILEGTNIVSNNIDMGEVFINSSSNKTLTIRNVGTQSVNLTSITFNTAIFNSLNSTISIPSCATGTPTFTTAIIFAPTQVQDYSSPVTINSDATLLVNSITVSGSGKNVPTPKISISNSASSNPNIIVYPDTEVNTFSTAFITVQNIGELFLTINNISISSISGSVAFFSVSPLSMTTVSTLAPNALTYITAVFGGASAGNYLSRIKINSNSGGVGNIDSEVFLFGQTIVKTRTATFSTAGLNFNSANISTSSTETLEQTFNIGNIGNADFYLKSPNYVSITGSSDFTFITVESDRIVNGTSKGTVEAKVRFKPTSLGLKTAILTLLTNETLSNPLLSLTLQGYGTSGKLDVSPTSWSFGTEQAFTSVKKQITIKNTGNGALNITNIRGISPPFTSSSTVILSPFTTTSLAAGASLLVDVTFSPTLNTVYPNQNLLIDTDAGTGTRFATISITGTGKQAQMNVDVIKKDFGRELIGTNFTTTITIKNTGNDDLVVLAPSVVSVPASTYFSIINFSSNLTIAPNSSHSFQVKFAPLTASDDLITANINLISTNKATATTVFNTFISVHGQGINRILRVSDELATGNTLNFGGKKVIDPTGIEKRFKIFNDGNDPFTINTATLSAYASEYTITYPQGMTVPANSHITANVVFKPTSAGNKNAILTISALTASVQITSSNINLIGTGETRFISVSENPMDFGNTVVGTTNNEKILTIKNTGNTALIITGLSTGTGYERSALISLPMTIAAGISTEILIKFKPTSIDHTLYYNQDFIITSDADNVDTNDHYFITTTGVPTQANILLSTTSIDFVTVEVSFVSVATFTITNTGTALLRVTSISANSSVYTTNLSNFTLLPNAVQEVKVSFQPIAKGVFNPALTITSDAANGIQNISLLGQGTEKPTLILNVVNTDLTDSTIVDFDYVPLNSEKTLDIKIENKGNTDFLIENILLTGNATDYTIKPFSKLVAAKQEKLVQITFKPTSLGNKDAQLQVTLSPTTPATSVLNDILNLTGKIGTREIEFTGDLNFGAVEIDKPVSKTIKIRNKGNMPLDIYTIGGLPSPPFKCESLTRVLQPNGDIDMLITFTPDKAISYNQKLIVNANLTDGINFITATGSGIATYILNLSPSTVDFGNTIRVDETSADQKLTIRNNGNTALTITNLTFENHQDQYQIVDFYDELILDKNTEKIVNIRFIPKFDGEQNQNKSTVLHVKTKETLTGGISKVGINAIGKPRATRIIQLIVDGKETNQVDFGKIEVRNPQNNTKKIVIRNIGNSDLKIEKLVSSNYSSELEVSEHEKNIPAGKEITIDLTFKPAETITYSSMLLTIRGSDKNNKITGGDPVIVCSGIGTEAVITLTPTTISFKPTRVNEIDSAFFSIQNTGSADLLDIKITSTDNTIFSTDIKEGDNIAVGKSRLVKIIFKPKQTGIPPYLGALDVTAKNASKLQQVGLSGEGIQAEITLSDSTINFGELRKHQSATKSFTIQNTGKAVLYITGIQSSNSVFNVSWKQGEINPSASQKIDVTFNPLDTISETGTLTIKTRLSTKGSEKTVKLTGTGIKAHMQSSIDFLDFGLCNNNSSKTAFITITNTDKATLFVNAVEIKNNKFTIMNAGSFSLEKSKEKVLELRFSPNVNNISDDTDFEDELVVTIGKPESTSGADKDNDRIKTIKLKGTAIVPLVYNANFFVKHQETVAYGQKVIVELQFTTGAKAMKDGISVYSSPISAAENGLKLSNNKLDTTARKDTFEAFITTAPTSNDIGVVYKITVMDRLGKKHESLKFYTYIVDTDMFLNLKAGEEIKDYQIVSIPYWLENPKIVDQFNELGKYNIKQWRLFRYDANTQQYVELGNQNPNGKNNDIFENFEIGQAYMCIIKDPEKAKNINIENYQSYNNTTKITEDKPFSLTLKKGWNLISSPYDYDIAFSKLRLERGSISPYIYTKVEGESWYSKDNIIRAKKGAFVKCDAPTTIVFPVFKDKNIPGQKRAEDTQNIFSENQFDLNFTITDGKQQYHLGGFGMNPQAKMGEDQYDDPLLPMLSDNELRLQFQKQNNESNLTKSVVPTAENHIWEMEIKGEEEFLEIHWDKNYFNTDKQIILYEMATQTPIDMKNLDKYRFKRQETNKFKIYYGNYEFFKEQMKASKVIIGEIYPNPYESDVYIPFSMPFSTKAYQVELNVYDLGGRKIDQQKKSYSYGFHTWKYSNLPANKGNYLIKMVISDSKTVYERVFKTISQ